MVTDEDIWLWFDIAFSPANIRFWNVASYYENIYDMYDDLSSRQCGYVTQKEAERIYYTNISQVNSVKTYCQKHNISIVTYDSENYPQKLRYIDCPPIVLFYRGDIKICNEKSSIAIVGARNACDYSCAVAQHFADYLTKSNLSIISGGAIGIDYVSHSSALNAGGKTVCVIGCGIDYDYPKGSFPFKKKISENGVVISEFFPQAKPLPENFKIRNRIVSGLSDGILVVEASIHSGTLNTVNHGLEQNKDVFVIPPHDILSDRFVGQSALLNDGAIAVYTPQEIIYYMK